jgi:hypothetical protein
MIRLTDSARALLAVVSVFVMGAVAGVVLDRSILVPPNADARVAGAGHDVRRNHQVLAELRAELGLSAEQTARVGEILAGHKDEMEAAWAEVHANVRRAMQEATAEIESVLDSAQVERLRVWLAERHRPISGHAPNREH